MELLSLLAITFPIFYLYGLVTFIRRLSSKSSRTPVDRERVLVTLLAELKEKQKKNPDIKVAEVIFSYESELKELVKPIESSPKVTIPNSNILTQDLSSVVSNWYSDNSINVLLYIGAFLIVASASIFVGFQWESIDGLTKALLMLIFTLAWLGAGSWFYRLPKIRTAGLTFLGVGALLVPFCGLAIYNFVLAARVIPFGTAWLMTSFIAFCVYALLIMSLRKPFFTYLLNLSVLSVVFSFVNTLHLANEFYILGTMVTAIFLLVIRMYLGKDETDKTLFIRPFELSANLMMPIALIVGLMTVFSQGNIFTFETTMAALLGVVYYLLFYAHSRNVMYAHIAQCLTFVFFIFALNWQKTDKATTFYCLELVSAAFLMFAYALKHKNPSELIHGTVAISLLTTVIWYVFQFILGLPAADNFIFAAGVSVLALLCAVFLDTPKTRYLANIFLYVSVSHILTVFNINNAYIPLAFMTLSFGLYLLSFALSDMPAVKEMYVNSSIAGGMLTFIFFSLYGGLDVSGYSRYGRLSGVFDLWRLTSLLTSYLYTGLLVLHAYVTKKTSVKYLASAVGVATYLHHVFYLEVSHLQIYTLPLALYFLTLGILRRRARDISTADLMDVIGMVILIGPTLGQAWSADGVKFAMLLGLEGILLIVAGNSLQHKKYIYGGVAAIVLTVLSQTHDYLLSMPRWMVTGIGGLVFMAVALYLLVYRKEHKP